VVGKKNYYFPEIVHVIYLINSFPCEQREIDHLIFCI